MANKFKIMMSRAGLKIKKHSPTILTISGVIGLTAAGVLACVQSRKVDQIIEKHKNRLEDIQDCKDEIIEECGEVAYRGSIVKAYANTALDFTKLYGIPLLLASASITAILCGHNVISKRHAALSTAYNSLNTAFNSYRERVRKDVGADKEMEYYTGKQILREKNETDRSEERVIKDLTGDIGKDGYSPYARFFDETSDRWTKDPLFNKNTIIGVQNWANTLLMTRGHVFLNEVYEALGFKHTAAGAVVGWYLSNDGSTDNKVDFGLYHDAEGCRAFINEIERNVLLDFNVDGVIYDLL